MRNCRADMATAEKTVIKDTANNIRFIIGLALLSDEPRDICFHVETAPSPRKA
jgi:hypothetical protein